MRALIAEVIAIGDELTSGFRLDTNSQWLSQQLGDLGITVMYHSTVGDDLEANIGVFANAADRADLVVCTGGLGPTADDLTRQVMATMAQVPLELIPEQLEHLKRFFEGRGRTMTPSNEIQAHFPAGSNVIPNPEGTAPGIELSVERGGHPCRFFALPGVPAEMRQMFGATVEHRIRQIAGISQMVHHHVVRCFGSGESHIESLLPDLVARGRDPLVGITASSGTISLRLTTKSGSVEQCMEKIKPTTEVIESILGDLVYGYNDDLLQSVVVDQLKEQGLRIAIADHGLHGDVASMLSKVSRAAAEDSPGVVAGSLTSDKRLTEGDMVNAARTVKQQFDSVYGVAIGSIDRQTNPDEPPAEFCVAVVDDQDVSFTKTFEFRGHSANRQIIACKRVLNLVRLNLKQRSESVTPGKEA